MGTALLSTGLQRMKPCRILDMKLCLALVLGGISSVLFSSCVRVSWERAWTNTPVPEETSEALAPGVENLGSCLETLGAPLYVWEVNAYSYAIAYGWNDGHSWGVAVSVSTDQVTTTVGDFDSVNLDLHGIVLAFDRQDRLLWRRQGHLRDIAYGLERPRPLVPVDEDPETVDP